MIGDTDFLHLKVLIAQGWPIIVRSCPRPVPNRWLERRSGLLVPPMFENRRLYLGKVGYGYSLGVHSWGIRVKK
jgi:hypothetical protein